METLVSGVLGSRSFCFILFSGGGKYGQESEINDDDDDDDDESDVETDLFYKIIDEDQINKFEDEFFAALSCENKSNPKRKKDHEEDEEDDDDDKNEKKQKTKNKLNIKYYRYFKL